MATISNVRLSIEKARGGTKRDVRVTYLVCFNECEIMAGSTFVERVTLRGDDPIFDDHQATLAYGRCVKAEKRCIERSLARTVDRSTLDEDGDTVIFGWVVHAARDELYARVQLTPYDPSGVRADSNIVTGQFGAGGTD